MNSHLLFTTQFEIATSKQSPGVITATGGQECIFLDWSDRAKLTSRTGLKGEAKAELQFQLEALDSEDSKKPQVHYLELGREGGGVTRVLLVHSHMTVFELHEAIRKNLGCVTAKRRNSEILVDVSGLKEAEQKKILEALASFLVLQAWAPEKYGRKAKSSEKKRALHVYLSASIEKNQTLALCEKARRLATATNRVRTLAELPGNHLNPGLYRKRVEEMAAQWKTQCEFLDVKELSKRKAGAFLAVVQADPKSEAGIAHLTYRGPGKNLKKIALVGKGLCFDTGGYNIKTGNYMLGMHRDMTGSAVALATFGFLVESRAPLEVHCYLAIADNLISPTGFRPNDVVVASDGTSIEVIDTDAEGRMVLADTLSIASREVKPDLMLDFATLTGSCVRALDTRRSGVFSHTESLAELAVQCGKISGERVWHFPIGEDYADYLKSDIADTLQLAKSSGADHIYAATFLSHFAGKSTPWVHMDLSADTNKGGLGLVATETTGFGVRWAVEMISHYFKH